VKRHRAPTPAPKRCSISSAKGGPIFCLQRFKGPEADVRDWNLTAASAHLPWSTGRMVVWFRRRKDLHQVSALDTLASIWPARTGSQLNKDEKMHYEREVCRVSASRESAGLMSLRRRRAA